MGNWSDENIITQSTLKDVTPMAFTPKFSFIATYRQNRLALNGRPRIELPVFDNEFIAFANSSETTSQDFMTNAGKYVDVFSTNYYNRQGQGAERSEEHVHLVGQAVDLLRILHAGSGCRNGRVGAGFEGIDQRARVLFYQNFISSFLETGCVVGFHWFKFEDDFDSTTGLYSNKGLYNPSGVVYSQLAASMKTMNDHVYDYIDSYDRRSAPTYVIGPEADAYFKDNTNYGSDPDLQIKATTSTTLRRAYLRFNVSAVSAPVLYAYISLKSVGTVSNIGAYRAEFVADDSWVETTITKSNAPAGSDTLFFWGFGRIDHAIDVTSKVRDAIAGDKSLFHASQGRQRILQSLL